MGPLQRGQDRRLSSEETHGRVWWLQHICTRVYVRDELKSAIFRNAIKKAIVDKFPYAVQDTVSTLCFSCHGWTSSTTFKRCCSVSLSFSNCRFPRKRFWSSFKVLLESFTKLKPSHLVLRQGVKRSFFFFRGYFSPDMGKVSVQISSFSFHCAVSLKIFSFFMRFDLNRFKIFSLGGWKVKLKTSFVRSLFSSSSASSVLILTIARYRRETRL